MSDRLRVDGLSWECIIGVHPAERVQAQTVTADVELELDVTAAARGCDLALTIDYSRFAAELGFILVSGKFLLLETAALALCHWLLAPDPKAAPVLAASVRLGKPGALGGQGIPYLSVRRRAAEVRPRRLAGSGDVVEQVYACNDASLYRIRGSQPGLDAPPPLAPYLRTHDLLLADGRTLLRVATSL